MGIAQEAQNIVHGLTEAKVRLFLLRLLAPRVRREMAASARKPALKRKGTARGLKAKLDRAFSLWIRHRDCQLSGGHGSCVTCGKIEHYRDFDCGHFMSRGFMATRWDPQNCRAQCKKCNRFQEGLHLDFAKAIDAEHGQGTAARLMLKAKTGRAPYAFEMQTLLAHYLSAAPGKGQV